MLITRFHTHSPQQKPWRNSQTRSKDASLPPMLPIPGYALFCYDTQNLSPVSAERAAEGIEASFIFHSLKNQNRYIAFQLFVPIAVRVYDSAI